MKTISIQIGVVLFTTLISCNSTLSEKNIEQKTETSNPLSNMAILPVDEIASPDSSKSAVNLTSDKKRKPKEEIIDEKVIGYSGVDINNHTIEINKYINKKNLEQDLEKENSEEVISMYGYAEHVYPSWIACTYPKSTEGTSRPKTMNAVIKIFEEKSPYALLKEFHYETGINEDGSFFCNRK